MQVMHAANMKPSPGQDPNSNMVSFGQATEMGASAAPSREQRASMAEQRQARATQGQPPTPEPPPRGEGQPPGGFLGSRASMHPTLVQPSPSPPPCRHVRRACSAPAVIGRRSNSMPSINLTMPTNSSESFKKTAAKDPELLAMANALGESSHGLERATPF